MKKTSLGGKILPPPPPGPKRGNKNKLDSEWCTKIWSTTYFCLQTFLFNYILYSVPPYDQLPPRLLPLCVYHCLIYYVLTLACVYPTTQLNTNQCQIFWVSTSVNKLFESLLPPDQLCHCLIFALLQSVPLSDSDQLFTYHYLIKYLLQSVPLSIVYYDFIQENQRLILIKSKNYQLLTSAWVNYFTPASISDQILLWMFTTVPYATLYVSVCPTT